MLDELGVQNSWNVVEDAGRIVVEARQDFNRSRKTEMRKAAIIAAVGTVIALLGIYALFGTVADDTIATVTTAVGGVVAYRGFKRRDQLGRQSFRNSFRFSS